MRCNSESLSREALKSAKDDRPSHLQRSRIALRECFAGEITRRDRELLRV